MLVWIIIVLVLAIAFGPVLYLLPTRKDRRLAAMRLEARRQGLVVELAPVRKLEADADERVSAGGVRRSPVYDSLRYALPLGATPPRMRAWRLLRSARSGWVFDMELAPPPGPELLAEILPYTRGLPDDAVALEWDGTALACYWLERFPANGDTVKALKTSLAGVGARLAAMDAKPARRQCDPD